MKRSVLLTLGLLILLAAPIHAQEPTPAAPWPPDPALIFADGVTWEEVQPASPATQSMPRVIDDFERDMIRVRDEATDTWREFPYPPGVEYVNHASLRADGLVWLLLLRPSINTNDPRPDDFILLDPATGEYSPPPTVCDGRVIQAEPGEGAWVAAYAPGTSDHATLCHSETGEQRDILPAEGMDWRVSESPSGDWIILAGWIQDDQGYAYAYPAAGGDLTVLGVIPHFTSEYIGFCGWVSEEKGVLCTSSRMMPSSAATHYYAFDVTQPDSLERLFSGWDNVFFDWDNAQLVSLHSDDYFTYWSGSVGAGRPCTLSIYDADGLHEFELDYECRIIPVESTWRDALEQQLFYQQDNMFYFLTTGGEDATVAELRSYNLGLEPTAPGQMAVLFSGEIEAIQSVSPDHRYVVLITDSNGELDQYPIPDGWSGWEVAVIDSTLGLDMPRYWSEAIEPAWFVWQDNDTLLVFSETAMLTLRMDENGTVPFPRQGTLRRITLNEDGSVDLLVTSYPPQPYQDYTATSSLSPNSQYVLVRTGIVKLATFEYAAILQDDVPASYQIDSGWSTVEGELWVKVSQDDNTVVYYVDLPTLWTSLP